MQTGDHNVLIIPWVTDNRCVVGRISRQVLELAAAFDPELDRISGIL